MQKKNETLINENVIIIPKDTKKIENFHKKKKVTKLLGRENKKVEKKMFQKEVNE